jgi:hypothetical protein
MPEERNNKHMNKSEIKLGSRTVIHNPMEEFKSTIATAINVRLDCTIQVS